MKRVGPTASLGFVLWVTFLIFGFTKILKVLIIQELFSAGTSLEATRLTPAQFPSSHHS